MSNELFEAVAEWLIEAGDMVDFSALGIDVVTVVGTFAESPLYPVL